MYKKVLIADDTKSEIQPIINSFKETQVSVVYAQNPDEVYVEIENRDIDLLILDWYFVLPSSNQLALEVINVLIDKQYYIPIFVYSNNIGIEDLYKDIPEKYPRILLNSMSKPNPSNGNLVKREIDKWFRANLNVSLANRWYEGINNALAKTLLDIYNIAGGGVINLLRQTYSSQNDSGAKDITNLIMTVFQDNLIYNSGFLEKISNILNKSNFNENENTYENYKLLRAFEMYSTISNETPISTGDIFLFDSKWLNKNRNKIFGMVTEDEIFAVVISGECDYANSSTKLRYHKLVLGTRIYDMCRINITKTNNLKNDTNNIIGDLCNHKDDSRYLMPFCNNNGKFEDIVFDFQNLITIRKEILDDELKKIRICRLRTNYYQHLLRRYSAFSSRIGIPEIPAANRKNMADSIIEMIKSKVVLENKTIEKIE